MIISIERATDAAEARRRATTLARDAGFDAEQEGRLAIVATELATNIVKHAGKGELVAQSCRIDDASPGVELIAIDAGPGIADLARARADGYSTAGSQGTGLGAILRLADETSAFTRPGQGTVMLARLGAQRARAKPDDAPPFSLGAIAAICPGESVSGDAWIAQPARERCRLAVLDGSGHGEHAAAAANTGIALIEAKPGLGLVELVTQLHGALAHTRGASAGLIEIDRLAGLVRFAGLGNISATLITREGRRGLVSAGGTLGHTWRTVREFTHPFSGAATLIAHSDGIATRWNLEAYPGLETCHAAVIAGVLYRDFRRGRDDATVVVVKIAPRRPT